MHLNVDGTVFYGLRLEAVMDRLADDISLDHLSRVLVDVHQVNYAAICLLSLNCDSLYSCCGHSSIFRIVAR